MARWATIKEAAEYMNIHPQTIYSAISKGEDLGSLFYKIKGQVTRRANLDEIDAFIKGEK